MLFFINKNNENNIPKNEHADTGTWNYLELFGTGSLYYY